MERETHMYKRFSTYVCFIHMENVYRYININIYIYTWPRRAALPWLIGLDLGAGSLLGWLPSGRQACWQAIRPSDCVPPSRLSGCLARWLASWLDDWPITLVSSMISNIPVCLLIQMLERRPASRTSMIPI